MRLYIALSTSVERNKQVLDRLQQTGHTMVPQAPPQLDLTWKDYEVLSMAELGIGLMPCGPSSYFRVGWMAGAGKPTFILPQVTDIEELLKWLAQHEAHVAGARIPPEPARHDFLDRVREEELDVRFGWKGKGAAYQLDGTPAPFPRYGAEDI